MAYRRTMTMALAAGLLASASLVSLPFAPQPARAHAATLSRPLGAHLGARDLAAFVRIWPSVQQCNTDLSTVSDDLQQATDNLSAGSTDTGSLSDDGSRMRFDCLAAAHRVYLLRFGTGPRHGAARRVKAELGAALVDLAQGADDCARGADAVDSGDYSSASTLLQDGEKSWGAATAHMRVANSYVQ